MPAERGCGGGEDLEAREFFAKEPRDFARGHRVGEKRIEAEAFAGALGQTGDELAADAMTRIAAGFEQRDVDTGTAQGKSERKAGEAAADDFDGTVRRHERRIATSR